MGLSAMARRLVNQIGVVQVDGALDAPGGFDRCLNLRTLRDLRHLRLVGVAVLGLTAGVSLWGDLGLELSQVHLRMAKRGRREDKQELDEVLTGHHDLRFRSRSWITR